MESQVCEPDRRERREESGLHFHSPSTSRTTFSSTLAVQIWVSTLTPSSLAAEFPLSLVPRASHPVRGSPSLGPVRLGGLYLKFGEQRRWLAPPGPSSQPQLHSQRAYRLRVAAVDGGADGRSLALGPAVHLVDDPVHLGARQTVEQHRGGTGDAAAPRKGLPPASAAWRSRR